MQRRTTNTVHVGDIAIGSGHPIAVQSMLCVAPSDLAANIAQTLVLKEAGCDIVRLAIPTMDDIRLISAIKNEVDIPLVADIQFDYRLAIAAVKAGIDKVRINPGNIGGSDRVHAVVEACRDRHIPIRIGVNSGSLEKDILQKYGRPTAEALVESALRHIQLLEDEHFTDYLVAIKSSDTITTVEANRLLAQKVDCPLHLGVTEAGTERMGIIKSSAGLGALLCEGIGDTVRVSLTADPVREVYAARDLLAALGFEHSRVQFVSCPTCGRCQVDLLRIAEEAEHVLSAVHKDIKVAVMGCAVNGPGEAADADIGIAGGNGEFLFFAKGKPLYKVSPEQVINTLLDEVEKL
jgi:4-hydroxy-3-methylbut-2-en-1-yl diphosphate synthase